MLREMIPALQSAVLGIRANALALDRAAGDIANANTPGYRGGRAGDRPGAVLATASPLDLAVNGAGWFRIASSGAGGLGEIVYSRAGAFHRDAQGRVATADGRVLVGYALDADGRSTGEERPIEIPGDAIAVGVSADGVVSATRADGSTTRLGAVSLSRFPNAGGLDPVGGGAYRATTASGAPIDGTAGSAGFGPLLSGTLESSNVDLAESVVDSLLARTGVAASAGTVRTADDVLGELVRLGRR